MIVFFLRRLLASALLLWVVLTATFALVHIAPGDPFLFFADPEVGHEQKEKLRRIYGLDRPFLEQYGTWLYRVTIEGDWGSSFATQRPATEVVGRALPNTLLLGFATLLVLYGVGMPLGILAAAKAGGPVDRGIRLLSLMLYAFPSFYLALIAIEVFAVRWPLFPAGHMTSTDAESWAPLRQMTDVAHHLILPAATLGLAFSGGIMRFVRNGLLEVLDQDFIRTAKAKGLSPARVLWVHALPNALGPVIQNLGLALPALLSGTLLIEVIFSWPGLGRVSYEAILSRDYPVVLASTALAGVLAISGNLLADLLHAWVDPRIRER